MTDHELEGALLALPLEEPPADLRRRILAATVYRPRLPFRSWEIWAIGTVVALMVWLALLVMTAVPDASGRLLRGLDTWLESLAATAASPTTLWTVLGISSALWVSTLSIPWGRPRRPAGEAARHG